MDWLAALPFFRISNYVEAGFWIALGIGVGVVGRKKVGVVRGRCVVAGWGEGGFWFGWGFGFGGGGGKKGGVVRGRCVVAAVDLVLFGLSDVVEAQTGAWYRPVGLLVWKGGCLVALAWLLVDYRRRKRLN